jgi:hypothetical protein
MNARHHVKANARAKTEAADARHLRDMHRESNRSGEFAANQGT